MTTSTFAAEQRKLLMRVTEITCTLGKWTIDPHARAATVTGDGLELVFRKTSEEDGVFWLRWDAGCDWEAGKLAADVRHVAKQTTSRDWIVEKKDTNQCDIKKA